MTSVRDVAPRPVRESRPEIARGLETQLVDGGIDRDRVKREYRLPHPDLKFAYDLAIPDAGVMVEIDGGAWLHTKGKTNYGHGQGKGFERDRRKDRLAVLWFHYRVLRYTPDEVKAGTAAVEILQAAAPTAEHAAKLRAWFTTLFKLKTPLEGLIGV
jgi:very-short-patch-repair endonuclease